MQVVRIMSFGTEADRQRNANGLLLEEVATITDFNRVLAGSTGRLLGYTDERGQKLSYQQAQQRLGQVSFDPPMRYTEEGEEC